MKTRVINVRTYKGKRSIKMVDRKTLFGNPFPIGKDGTRYEVVCKHRAWLLAWLWDKEEITIGRYNNKWVCQHIEELRGQALGCWCDPLPCHVDNLIWLLSMKTRG